MKLLLDTCTFLWLAADSPSLSAAARRACLDPGHVVYLSALSAWEIALKTGLGQLELPLEPGAYVRTRRLLMGIEPLPFDEEAALHGGVLPSHHRDPFDRGLVSQAILHGMTIVTPDRAVWAYPAPVLW